MSIPLPAPSADRTRTALAVLGTALALGITSDTLLRAMPWGLNVTLSTVALVVAAGALARRHRLAVGPDAPWLALTVLLLGAAFARRAANALALLDVAGLILALGLAAASAQGIRIRLLGVAGQVRAVVMAGLWAWLGMIPLFGDIDWRQLPGTGSHGERFAHTRAVGFGLLLAVPLLVVFGALFASADAVFGSAIARLFDINLPQLFSHLFWIGLWGALAAGYLRHALVGRPPETNPPVLTGGGPTLGIVPVATALGLLGLLFLAFVAVQLRYLFGGAATVQATAGLTYAEYARRGFFELVTASGLVLPLLLGADWLVRAEGPAQVRMFRRLAAGLLVLLAVVMASALERMRLYVAAFGLSEIRLYATAFMGYLVVLFGWFAATVLRSAGSRERFAFGGLVQGFTVLAGLHLLNPDAFIVRRNLAHPGSERPFDVQYAATTLSADAVPPLLEALPQLPAESRCAAARILLVRWGGVPVDDWRSWNWGRSHARATVRANAAQLRAWSCPVAPPSKPSPTAEST